MSNLVCVILTTNKVGENLYQLSLAFLGSDGPGVFRRHLARCLIFAVIAVWWSNSVLLLTYHGASTIYLRHSLWRWVLFDLKDCNIPRQLTYTLELAGWLSWTVSADLWGLLSLQRERHREISTTSRWHVLRIWPSHQ